MRTSIVDTPHCPLDPRRLDRRSQSGLDALQMHLVLSHPGGIRIPRHFWRSHILMRKGVTWAVQQPSAWVNTLCSRAVRHVRRTCVGREIKVHGFVAKSVSPPRGLATLSERPNSAQHFLDRAVLLDEADHEHVVCVDVAAAEGYLRELRAIKAHLQKMLALAGE